MYISVPESAAELDALRHYPTCSAVVASALWGVVRLAQAEGKTLAQLLLEVQSESVQDPLPDPREREQLCQWLTLVWEQGAGDRGVLPLYMGEEEVYTPLSLVGP